LALSPKRWPEVTSQMATEAAPVRNLRFSLDWITRPFFGVVLAAIAIAALDEGRWYFAAFVGVFAVGAAREWHRMVERGKFAREFWLSAAVIALALLVLAGAPNGPAAWIVLGAGAVVVLVSARLRGAQGLWHAAGVFYIGVPALLLVALRASGARGAWIIAGFLLIVWATDTGALIAGNLVGGRKLWPRLSPNKTWSGTLGGIAAAMAIEAIYIGALGGEALVAVAYAIAVATVAHGGDLLESAVKRRFSVKDSGGLIPGHGGVLDRIDSALAASTVVGFCVLVAGLDPLFGARL
jgi:phosphatidate cytidylyltransferase